MRLSTTSASSCPTSTTSTWHRKLWLSRFLLLDIHRCLVEEVCDWQAWPWLRNVPLFGHFGYDLLKRAAQALWDFIDAEIARSKAGLSEKTEAGCFVEAYLKEMEERERSGTPLGSFDEFQLSRTVGDFWFAGFETTVTTLRWGLVYMTHYPEAQARIHQELDAFYAHNPDKYHPSSTKHRWREWNVLSDALSDFGFYFRSQNLLFRVAHSYMSEKWRWEIGASCRTQPPR